MDADTPEEVGASLPLMRKTFIEASTWSVWWESATSLFRLCGRLSLRLLSRRVVKAPIDGLFRLCGRLSLRQRNRGGRAVALIVSLPLMRKTFIEASPVEGREWTATRLFRLCGRLSLRHDRHNSQKFWRGCLFCLCGRLSLRRGTSPRVRRILLFPPLLWRLSLRAGEVRIYPQLWLSAAYIADFHF